MNFKKYLLSIWNFWPPFFGAGIKIKSRSQDWRKMVVELKLRPWTSNYVGTQFGGSMFAMTDAFYMVMLLRNLGSDYWVWDQSASIRFLKPGKTHLTAEFELDAKTLDEIRLTLTTQPKMHWQRTVHIKDLYGEIVAEVDKVIYIKRKGTSSSSRD